MPSVIKIPEELARELDRLAGADHRPRAAYVVDVLWRDVWRNSNAKHSSFPPEPGIPPTIRS